MVGRRSVFSFSPADTIARAALSRVSEVHTGDPHLTFLLVRKDGPRYVIIMPVKSGRPLPFLDTAGLISQLIPAQSLAAQSVVLGGRIECKYEYREAEYEYYADHQTLTPKSRRTIDRGSSRPLGQLAKVKVVIG
jgi:hypothetical protein